jgi:dolichol-phosphate mannosyltransferase
MIFLLKERTKILLNTSLLYALLKFGQVTLKKLLRQRVFRFLVGGGLALAFNILLIFVMIKLLGLNTPVLRNIANAVSIEVSLLFSFLIYRTWVWPGGNSTIKEILWRQIPLYHLSAGAAVGSRILIVFPILDWLGVNYVINTLVGVSLGASLNYLISDRFVFSDRFDL